jgi:type I restriction enzyme S subunit
MALARPDRSKIDPRFFLFTFLGAEFQEVIRKHTTTGSTVDRIPLLEFPKFPLRLPPIEEQRAIASVLGSLDDRIETNRKVVRVLEGVARAVFTSWFVNFDPVHRAARGEPTGLPAEVSALFPKRFADSPIGGVPEGWRVVSVPEAFEVNPPRALRKGEVAPYLDMSNMPTQGHAPAAWVQREVGSGMRFTNGDTLVARITPCLENGKTAFVDFLADGEVAWGSTEYIVLRPRAPLPAVFAYLLARSDAFRTFAIQAMTGSSGRQRVPAESLAHFLLAVPPEHHALLAERFGRTVEPLFGRMNVAMHQSRVLAALRDVLLPRLISGELRIADAEKIIGRADV